MKRSSKNITPVTLGYLVNLCEVARTTRDSCLIALLYLSGRRIGEVLELRKQDIQFNYEFMEFYTFNEKNVRKTKQGSYQILRGKRYYERILIRFSVQSDTGSALVPYVLGHLQTLHDDEFLFYPFRPFNKRRHIKRCMAYKIVTFIDPDIWLHWFRHQRFTQLADVFKAEPLLMHEFTKHKRFENTLTYIHRHSLNERIHEF